MCIRIRITTRNYSSYPKYGGLAHIMLLVIKRKNQRIPIRFVGPGALHIVPTESIPNEGSRSSDTKH